MERWYDAPLRATIDAGGRVVIPKLMRERLRLMAGTEIEITERDGWVEISPVSTAMTLVGDEPVASTDRAMPVLTADTVRQTMDQLRR